ncbi:MAG: hypothetical protein MUF51_05540 [Vicinamibacteria bacterium]|jgi:hypothetical protein|nr:hypothetical protein [Vicinamibacteria bacterium]
MSHEDPSDLAEITALVRRHGVYYEVWPDTAYERGQRMQIGYEMELVGRACDEPHDPGPGCEICDGVCSDLTHLGEWAIARAAAEACASVDGPDAAWHASPKRGLRPEIVVTLRITRHSGNAETVDAGEKHALTDVEAALKSVGVKAGGPSV